LGYKQHEGVRRVQTPLWIPVCPTIHHGLHQATWLRLSLDPQSHRCSENSRLLPLHLRTVGVLPALLFVLRGGCQTMGSTPIMAPCTVAWTGRA